MPHLLLIEGIVPSLAVAIGRSHTDPVLLNIYSTLGTCSIGEVGVIGALRGHLCLAKDMRGLWGIVKAADITRGLPHMPGHRKLFVTLAVFPRSAPGEDHTCVWAFWGRVSPGTSSTSGKDINEAQESYAKM